MPNDPQVIHTAHLLPDDDTQEGLFTNLNDAHELQASGPALIGLPTAGTGPAKAIPISGSLTFDNTGALTFDATSLQSQIDSLTGMVSTLQGQVQTLQYQVGLLLATAKTQPWGQATLSGSGALAATARLTVSANALLAGTARFILDDPHSLGAILAGAGGFSAAAAYRWPAAARLAGVSALVVAPGQRVSGSARLAGAGALTAIPNVAYSTLDPANKATHVTLTNGNLTASSSNVDSGSVRGTHSRSSGKRYFEFTINVYSGDSLTGCGLCDTTFNPATFLGWDPDGWALICIASNTLVDEYNFTTSGHIGTVNTSSVMMVAADLTAGNMWLGIDGVWTGDPASGVLPNFTFTPGTTMYPACAVNNKGVSTQLTFNPGSSLFAYSLPSGFSAWG